MICVCLKQPSVVQISIQFAFTATPVIVWISERWTSRQAPLISGLVALICSQVMLMEARAYWVMAVARVIQGMSSSMVWTVGLALL